MEESFPKKVELIGVLSHPDSNDWSPEDYAVSGAMGCFDEKSTSDIHKIHKVDGVLYGKGKKKHDWEGTKELLMKETSGRGHGAVTDQSQFTFSIDNLTRASTLFLCGPEYASHLQQSLRRANAKRGFVLEDNFNGDAGFSEAGSGGNEIMKRQFDLYNRMKEERGSSGDSLIPTEDARIILPLNTKTAIQTTLDARELMHLNSMVSRMHITEDIGDTVNQMYDEASGVAPALMKNRDKNYEVLSWMPSPQLFATGNATLERLANEEKGMQFNDFSKGLDMTPEEIKRAVEDRDEALLANLKHYHFSFSIPMSLMSFHQATRQRTWNQSVEPLTNAVKRGKYVTPDSIAGTRFESEYKDLCEKSIDYVVRNSDSAESFGVLPHSLEVYDAIHVNGWNAIHSIGKRTCKTAQWEIRDKAKYMAREIRKVAPELGKYSRPQGIIYGGCPERENCGKCGK